ncbi:MAG: GNAT family N-acetyltransferase [Candidatus Velthaea sp.]
MPHSSGLWADGRTLEEYVGEFHEIADSAYGRRRFRTLGLRVDGALVASCKRYEREIRCGAATLRAAGIGAVFTPPPLRGRGYASAMLGAFLDAERDAGTDIAYLFSAIHPAFYERLGFIALPSRSISLRSDTLGAKRVAVAPLAPGDWPAIRRCFEMLDGRRAIAFKRTPLVWEWLRIAARSRAHEGQRIEMTVRRGRSILAYVFGRRIPRADAFVIDEFAYTGDEGFDAMPPLLRSAAGDLRKITGWLPPDIARAALPKGAVKRRKSGISMIALLSPLARAGWGANGRAILDDAADRCWSTDYI